MQQNQGQPGSHPSPSRNQHLSVMSQESGILDTRMSYGTLATNDSVRLSHFPHPPTELPQAESVPPSSPGTQSTFTARSNRQWEFVSPRNTPTFPGGNGGPPVGIFRQEATPTGSPATTVRSLPQPPQASSLSKYQGMPDPASSSMAARNLSPHDWHEGSSSIFVDTAEERMLPTSLITQLLSDGASEISGITRLQQFNDAASSFSELTYPPTGIPPSYPQQQDSQSSPATANSSAPPVQRRYSRQNPPTFPSLGRSPSHARRQREQAARNGVPAVALHNAPGHRMTQSLNARESRRTTYNIPEDEPHQSFETTEPLTPTREATRHPRRHSVQSTKTASSFVPSLFSKLSGGGIRSRKSGKSFAWGRAKPNMSNPPSKPSPANKHLYVSAPEDDMALPELVSRAGQLQQMLEKGYHPHKSLYSTVSGGDPKSVRAPESVYEQQQALARPSTKEIEYKRAIGEPIPLLDANAGSRRPPMSKRKKKVIAISCIAAVVIVVAAVVGGVVGSNHSHSHPNCAGNFTGAHCDIDVTCICTSSTPGRCDGLAQNLVNLTPTMNNLFSTNYSTNDVSTAFWVAQGSSTASNCASQADLIDVSSAFDVKQFPNRTAWIESALLWNFVRSQDVDTASDLQQFVNKAPWKSLGSVDHPNAPNTKFVKTGSGYSFDFGAQTVSQPSVSFVSNGQAKSAQLAQVSADMSAVLDRVYTQALASSTQASIALATYWRSVLQQKPANLALFVSAIASSPIVIPFDATASPGSHAISDLLTKSTTAPFPPPLGCYPGLDTSQTQRINTLESSVFGLPNLQSPTNFDPTCFASRPLYGVLDVLRLRLPFVDSRTGVAKQAVVLNRDVSPRTVVYNGEILAALPGAKNLPGIKTAQTDLREFGTLNHLNRVVFNYLTSFPDVQTATAFVNFVLSSPAVPPTSSSPLFNVLSSIPALEVAVFGNIDPSDITSAISSFSTPSGSLFFGSDQGAALRTWAINAGFSVVWAELATSPKVVRDSSMSDAGFNSVWTPAQTILHSQTGVTAGVSNVTASFEALGEFVV